MNQIEVQLNSIDEYMVAAQDFHDALTLLSEAKMRVRAAIKSNSDLGLSKPDPLGLGRQVDTAVSSVAQPVDVVANKITTDKKEKKQRTKNSPRNSPGFTKKAVYDALPGDVDAIASRTGLTRNQVWSAAADLAGAGLIERHGTRGNTTYVVSGDRLNWTQRQFGAIRYTEVVNISN